MEKLSLLFIVRSYFFQRRELGALIEGLKKLFLRSKEQYPLFLGMLSSLSCGILEMHFEESILPLLFGCYELHLTNGPQFSMVYTLTDHRNDVIKCSKFKCNLELQTSSFTAKFWTFYGVISMVYTSVDHGKLWSILSFYRSIFLRKTKNKATATAWHVTSFPWSILS